MRSKCSMASRRIYPKAMLSLSKDVFIKDTLGFRKAIPIADSEAVLKIAFPLPSFSSSLCHAIPHMGKQITAVGTSCMPLRSAKTVGPLGELPALLKLPL